MKIRVFSLFLIFVSTTTNLSISSDAGRDGVVVRGNMGETLSKNVTRFKRIANRVVFRKRRGASPSAAFYRAHQLFPKSMTIEENEVCHVEDDTLLVNEFTASSLHLKTKKGVSGSCQLHLNGVTEAIETPKEGFIILGDLGTNAVYNRELGVDLASQSENKVEQDLVIELANEVDLKLSELYNCKDSSAFSCGSTCIGQDAMCDKIENCKDGSDEEPWRCGNLGYSKVWCLIALIILVVIIVPPVVIVNRLKKKKQPRTSQIAVSASSVESNM